MMQGSKTRRFFLIESFSIFFSNFLRNRAIFRFMKVKAAPKIPPKIPKRIAGIKANIFVGRFVST